jgi:uncharacterized heparinase superfamily protein
MRWTTFIYARRLLGVPKQAQASCRSYVRSRANRVSVNRCSWARRHAFRLALCRRSARYRRCWNYLYHSNRSLRDLFRDTAIHNTLSLDGIGSSSASGPFNWVSKADARLISSESTPIARVVAEHDGYVGQYGVKHRRNVEFDGAFAVHDRRRTRRRPHR